MHVAGRKWKNKYISESSIAEKLYILLNLGEHLYKVHSWQFMTLSTSNIHLACTARSITNYCMRFFKVSISYFLSRQVINVYTLSHTH